MKKPPKGGFFNEIRPVGRVKSPVAVKSFPGEIPLRGVMDGFHLRAQHEDFTAA